MLGHDHIERRWPLDQVQCAGIDEEVLDLEIRNLFTEHPTHHPSPEARGLEDIRFVDRGDPSTPFTGQPPSDPGDSLDLGRRVDAGIVGALPPTLEWFARSEEHTSELQSRGHLVCRLL